MNEFRQWIPWHLERVIGKYLLAVWQSTSEGKWGWSIENKDVRFPRELAYGYEPTCRKAKLAAMRKLSSMKLSGEIE